MESSTPYKTLQPGEMLNWYRIERILGRGGFGVIYLATDTNLDHQVAIKEYIPAEVAKRSGDSHVHPLTEDHSKMFRWGMERFIKEARNLVKFKHPNIVRVMSVFQQNNTAYMVMEFEEGEDLRNYLQRGDVNSEHNLKSLILPISQGLAEVHRLGFIHRDIKPANILVRKNGSPVLLDFGSARSAVRSSNQQTMTAFVTAGYAPLEQYNGEGDEQQGPWTDIYALGGVLYKAITGLDPIDSTARGAALMNNAKDPLIAAAKLGKGRYSDAFLSAIDWALQFRIADRPQTLSDWLPALLGDKPVKDASEAAGKSGRNWNGNTGLGERLVSQLDDATFGDLSDETVLARSRTATANQAPVKASSNRTTWISIAVIVAAVSVWVAQKKPDAVDAVVGTLYQGEAYKARQAEQAAREQAFGEAARQLAIANAAKVAEELAIEEEATLQQAQEAAAQIEAEEAQRRRDAQAAEDLALETRRQAEEDAELERRRIEAVQKRRANRALTEASIAITRGDLETAQTQLAVAKGIGISDSRIANLERDVQAALEEYYKPVSDNDLDIVMRMFDALKRSIENKDLSAIQRLTNESASFELFSTLTSRFEKLEIEISSIKVRNADKSISGTLTIKSMIRENGDRATPSDAYRTRPIRSKRINGRWSVIEW